MAEKNVMNCYFFLEKNNKIFNAKKHMKIIF